ncbi:curlin repeat-containing protein [Sunxiuqinia indica]|uniref:curlin repeat-containing protein n=1 Tax=Sunxiuqinia indica TaxID=2692584 RepID=UPI00135A4FF0|nr:curlin repeat-containing protein [Sunxiuqinia indica]
MKKLSLLFAMLFVVGMAMSQVIANVSETEQDGNQNDVIVKQIGDLNDAASHQYGNKNDASVIQTGDENIGVADQLRGDRNAADVEQEGSLNEGYIQQGLTSDYYDGDPDAPAYDMYANDNDADVVQIGDENFSAVGQWGNSNIGSSDQVGKNNEVYIYQGWEGTWWGGPALYSTNSIVDISQLGDGNSGRVWQYGGNKNEGYVNQEGDDNVVSFVQGWIYTDLNYDFYNIPVYNTHENFASATQYGDGNHAKNIQLGSYNTFKLTQNGDNNSVGWNGATSLQESRNAYFTQDGNHNKFVGVWKSTGEDLSLWESKDAQQNHGSIVDVASYQRGDYNTIGLRQGKDDIALIQQNGISNEALLWQQGADQNNATMMQFGNNNSAAVVQIQQ